jgi:hypothetical protein
MAKETTLAKTPGASLPSESVTPATAGGGRSAAEKYSDAVSPELGEGGSRLNSPLVAAAPRQ